MKEIECVIMDWAGSAIDYGCFAPVSAFMESFRAIGIDITPEEARRPMGMNKLDHIRALFQMERISEVFEQKYGRTFNEKDVQDCYAEFQKLLFATLSEYTEPIPGVLEVMQKLRCSNIKIGSTTGYTKEMMDVVIPSAAEKGYRVDNYVTSEGFPGGRPYPYMIYKNMCDLGVPFRSSVLKFGDTISDIKEGINAGVWTVGVVLGSSELGLTEKEVSELKPEQLQIQMHAIRNRMIAAGAHYVINSIKELPDLIEAINYKMNHQSDYKL